MAYYRKDIENNIIKYCTRMYQKGFVANHDGNITARLDDKRIMITPTAMSKVDIKREHLIVVDLQGHIISGEYKPFSELALHLFIYRHRKDINAVVHTHAPVATALSIIGVPVDPTIMPEPVVSLGDTIPLIPYARPKTPEATLYLNPYIKNVNALVLQNHGVLAWGENIENAYLRMELVEHIANIQHLAMQLGKPHKINKNDIDILLKSRPKKPIL